MYQLTPPALNYLAGFSFFWEVWKGPHVSFYVQILKPFGETGIY